MGDCIDPNSSDMVATWLSPNQSAQNEKRGESTRGASGKKKGRGEGRRFSSMAENLKKIKDLHENPRSLGGGIYNFVGKRKRIKKDGGSGLMSMSQTVTQGRGDY